MKEFKGIGRTATAQEVAAWDIDVRPDFKGLPAGSGSVAQGMGVWEAQCASCHGVFGESNQVFSPLVGGTTAQDVSTGRVASLKDNSYPGRTTLMKLSSVSTLWDYINRAMPWTQPKSLTVPEVYAVTAYLLNLGGVVADDFTLSDKNIAQVQAQLPNRHGMTTDHNLWPGAEFAQVRGVQPERFMPHRAVAPRIASIIPDYARNAHGNLADQNRLVGAQRGVQTATLGALPTALAATNPAGSPASIPSANPALQLSQKYSCTTCHGATQKIVGPAFSDLAAKYSNQAAYLADKIVKGSVGVWGSIPMPAQALSEAEAKSLASWIASGAPP